MGKLSNESDLSAKDTSNLSEWLENAKKTGKKSVHHFLYGRSVIVVLMLLAQLYVLFLMMGMYKDYLAITYGGYMVGTVIVMLVVINSEENPIYKISWIVPILVLPVFGTLFYVWVKLQPMPAVIKKKLKREYDRVKVHLTTEENTREQIKNTDTGYYGTARYLMDYCGFPAYANTETKYYPIGEDYYLDLIEEIKKAEKYIFMEYFIISKGCMWDTILKILKEKAAAGVDVRVMYDGMCSLVLLPYSYPKELQKYGIKCQMFSPIKPILSIHQNNRDHRKILVIDGKVGFTGGVNLSDEYINIEKPFGHWKDTGIKLKGRAVNSMTAMFLQMWDVVSGEKDDYQTFIRNNKIQEKDDNNRGYVIPYGDTPFNREHIGEQVYMDILNQAKDYVYIMTPYLILDNEMKETLKYAAKRGVEVKIILPHIPDKRMAFALARSHYRELMSGGVEIYEYTPGFVHSKLFVSDGVKAAIGSVNLDYRSLYLHFECGVYMYGNSAITDMEQDYIETLEKCQKIEFEDIKHFPLIQKIEGRLLKAFSPLM